MADVVVGDFELSIGELRAVARYVLEAAAPLLPLYEAAVPGDERPRAAIDAAQRFIDGERRTKLQRVTALDAHRAATAAPSEITSLAAQAAGDAASAAYLHPISKGHQVGHILRAAANAARIAEALAHDDPTAGAQALQRAQERADATLVGILRRYPPAPSGRSQAAALMNELDAMLRQPGL